MSASSLKAFILRKEVIGLYRNFLKTVRKAPEHTQGISRLLSRRCVCDSLAAVLATGFGLQYWLPALVYAGDLKQQIRADFVRHRDMEDLYSVKYYLSDGRFQLKLLQEMMAMK